MSQNSKEILNSIFISADPPKPPTGGGVRTLNFALALSKITNCKSYILFPINNDDLPGQLTKQLSCIRSSTVSFSKISKGRVRALLLNLRWLLAPWSFRKSELMLFADYMVSNPYSGPNILARFFYSAVKYVVALYALFTCKMGYSIPARSLERLQQYNELKDEIYNDMKTSNLIWIDFSTLLPFFSDIRILYPAAKIICNAHNVEYKVLERMESLAKSRFEKFWIRTQAKLMKKVELNGFSKCDLIITCSEHDKNEILFYLPNSNVMVFPNGVDTDYFIPNSSLTQYPSLLFTGTMGYRPTRDAVEYFVEKIFPQVLEVYPTCKFIIAGANAGDAFKHFIGRDDIEIISSPIDMRPVYNQAWVVVVPLRVGGGTRLKILEAMAMEKPVVSTSIGVEGIQVSSPTHLFIVDEEKEFADKINLLISEFDLRAKISSEAKKRVFELYSWDLIRENFCNAI